MLQLSAAALAAVTGPARRPVRAEWTNDGGATWSLARVATAEVQPDRTAECRYSGSAELVDVPLGAAGINVVTSELRLFQGVQGPRMDEPEWVPAGRYVVDRVARTRIGARLELLGVEDSIRAAGFPVTRMIGPDSAAALASALVGEARPGDGVAWRPGLDPTTVVPAFTADDRWASLSGGTDTAGVSTGIAAALGGEVFADARGVMTIGPVPTLADPVVWRIPYGVAVVEPAEEQSAEGLVNVWAISGDGGDGSPAVGPIYVWDDDPNSLTYAGPDPVGDPLAPQRLGLIGVRVRVDRYSSPLITTTGQASDVGRAKLADSLGVQSSLSFTAVCHPGLEPGDVVEVEVRPGEWQRHIIDSCPYTLGAAVMSCTTRTSARRLT
ncbi:phage tail protein [Streptomyces sp. NPDC056255]|uniref:phage tail protein n=1 Tax=Streptomyces sp. NPDC056255 TaxID=3345764 RepID=UPI0035D5D6BB